MKTRRPEKRNGKGTSKSKPKTKKTRKPRKRGSKKTPPIKNKNKKKNKKLQKAKKKIQVRKASKRLPSSKSKKQKQIIAKPQPLQEYITPASSYEEALLQDIISAGPTTAFTYESAATFSRILLNLTKNTQTINYKFGMQIGKSLYKIVSKGKHYYWYEEAIPHIVSFLEKAGYGDVEYTFLHNGIRIRIYNKNAMYLGANMHIFEAGLISGFITAATGQITYINELTCSNNNSKYCEFVSSSQKNEKEITKMDTAITNFTKHLAKAINEQNEHKGTLQNRVALSYHALMVQPLINFKYSTAINNIAAHMGYKLGNVLFDDRKLYSKKLANYLSKTAILLNFGAPSIKDFKNLNMEFLFNPEVSKKEYLKLSLAFMNGLISKATKFDMFAEIKKIRNSYLLRMKRTR